MSVIRIQGFTLIELMITVAIVGILSSIAMPAYSGYVAKARFTEIIGIIEELERIGKECLATTTGNKKDMAACGAMGQSRADSIQSPYMEGLHFAVKEATIDPVKFVSYEIQVLLNLRALGIHIQKNERDNPLIVITSGYPSSQRFWRCLFTDAPNTFSPYAKLINKSCYYAGA